jgi:hypothetical protein
LNPREFNLERENEVCNMQSIVTTPGTDDMKGGDYVLNAAKNALATRRSSVPLPDRSGTTVL